jgi:hypothetical protein
MVERRMRELGWTERLFWLLDQNSPRHFVMAAHIDGHTTVDQWRKALDAVQIRHPLLCAGIEVGADSVPCFYRAAGAPIPLRVLEGRGIAQECEAELGRELALPFDPQRVPLMRAVLLHEPERAVCILATHHAIGDGMSIAFVVRDLLQALAGETLRPLPVPPTVDDLIGQAVVALERNSVDCGTGLVAPGPPARYRARTGDSPQVRTMQLAPEVLGRLRQRARAEKATLHGALCSGLALTLAQFLGRPASQPVRIWSPMDVRKLLGLGDDCAVLATSMIVAVECRGLPGFWGAAREVAARLAATRSAGYLAWASSLLSQSIGRLDVASAAQLMAQRFAFDLVVTNLGVVPYASRFGPLQLNALSGPAVLSGFENEHVFGVATVGEQLSLSYSSYTPFDSLFGLLDENLAAACDCTG